MGVKWGSGVGWEVIGPGILPGDVKVRCPKCHREKMILKVAVNRGGCKVCANDRKRRAKAGSWSKR